METLHKQRLRKLAAHLQRGKLGHQRFDFSVYHAGKPSKDHCGTAGCAIGECPIAFPGQWRFDEDEGPVLRRSGLDCHNSIETFFGLKINERQHLFVPTLQNPKVFGGSFLGFKATRQQVAANILAFLKKKGQ